MNFPLEGLPFGGSVKRTGSSLNTRAGCFGSTVRSRRQAGPSVAGTLRCLRTAAAAGLLAMAWLAGMAEATPTDRTLLEFPDESYALNPVVLVKRHDRGEPESLDSPWEIDNPVSSQSRHIARVRVVGHQAADALRFKVEGQSDQSSYELCYCPLAPVTMQCDRLSRRSCHEVGIDITEQSGVLSLVVPNDAPGSVFHYFRDFSRQRVELSVTEGDHKVYREVRIEPPDDTPDCSDYPDTDVDRYACLYQGETLPSAPASDPALLAALPDQLVQPKEHYELIFAEEFNGDTGRYPTGDCEGGLSNLDGDKWNFSSTWCKSVDAANEPCETMRNGHYEMSFTEQCGSGLGTAGKFIYQYGYLETQYTVNLADSHPQNMAFVIGDHRRSLRYAAAKYTVPLRNYEEMAKALPIEINLFEYFPERRRELTNYFYNYHPYIYYPHTEPRYASNWTRFCYTGSLTTHANYFTEEQCAQREALTVTKGLEWTPRGYRMLVKVQDLHDDFTVVSKGRTSLGRQRARTRSTPTHYADSVTQYTGTTRDGFFEFLEPGNPDSVLTQFAIGHAPMHIWLDAWRGFGNEPDPENNLTTVRMKIDYVRVFQPRDRYADMEPVYE